MNVFTMKFTEDNTRRLVVMKRSKILYNGLFVKNEGRLSETGMGTILVSSQSYSDISSGHQNLIVLIVQNNPFLSHTTID